MTHDALLLNREQASLRQIYKKERIPFRLYALQ